ncbi:MAG: hypothetical protein IJQ77_11165 [Synergistaceae bacterium]|nr:hypothetical protein [Synergistaceae bacterium]
MNIETLKQMLEGTDDLSMARGLAYGVLYALNASAHEISECLFKGTDNAEGVLSVINWNIDFLQNNLNVIQNMTRNFECLCNDIRTEGNA